MLSFAAVQWVLNGPMSQTLVATLGAVGAAWAAGQKLISHKLLHWFNSPSSQTVVKRKLGLPDFREKMGVYHEIHRALDTLCSLCIAPNEDPSKGEYLLLVVDDLDRCEPETVKNVFDAVRLVADVHRVVTLVAIDERIAFAAVSKHFEKFGFAERRPELLARDYLAKVFQVAVTLPEIAPEAATNFIRHELFREDVPSAEDPLPLQEAQAGTASSKADEESMERYWQDGQERPAPSLLRTLPEEVTAFSDMATACGFSNPRQLWRVKQAWQLLKGIALREGSGMAELRPWMRTLFLREYVLQSPPAERLSIEGWLVNPKPGEHVPGVLRRLAEGPVESSFLDYASKVPLASMVLLPAAPPQRN